MPRISLSSPGRAPGPLAPKVPEITLLFWVIKLLTTGMGEAASDFLAKTNLVLAAAVGLFGFVAAMWLQLRARRYVASVYWFAVAMVAVFGTMAADGVHRVLGVAYLVTSVFYASALIVIFLLWYRSERTLSIHSIVSGRRESFYWLAVLGTFALGTAASDLTAFTLKLGFLSSIVLFAAAIVVPAIGYWRRWMNSIAAFWFAYILTRPLGASIADWLGKPHSLTGLGYGDGTVTVLATLAIVVLVAYAGRRDSDAEELMVENSNRAA